MKIIKNTEQGLLLLRLPLFLIILVLLPLQPVHAASDKYVVNLLSMKQDIRLDKVQGIDSLRRRYNLIVYSKPSGPGKVYVLSVGYFTSLKEATKVSAELSKTYRGTYPAKFISGYTIVKSIKKSATNKIIKDSTTPSTSRRSDSSLSGKRLDQIMNSAKSAIKQGENRQAIQLLSAILSVEENKYSREALELLGVARERNDQYNHAVNAYNKYIDKYPDSADLRRVKQRLAVLLTASKRVGVKDKKGILKKSRPWQMAGSLSQSYSNNNGDDADLYTFLSVAGRKRNEDTDLRLQFTGSRVSPIKGHTETDFQISEMFADILFRDAGLSTKFGRQRSRTGGIFGRLDGLLVSYDGSDSARFNIIAGIPVDSSRDFLFDTEKNKKLAYGINTDLSFFNKVLDINLYALEQRNDSILDRQVMGAEARVFTRNVSIFSLLDYDISYDETNIFLLTGNWKPSNNYNFFFNVDYRNNPLLTTTNALIGQTETDLGTLVSVLGEEAVRQLAMDRSSTSRLVSLGLLGPLSDSTTIRGDIATTEVSESPVTLASAGVSAVPGMPRVGPDYFYSLQFVTTDYFMMGDTSILQFQYADTETSQKFSSLVTTRLPLTPKLRVSPRAILVFNKFILGENRADLKTSVRTDYKYAKRLQMDVDIGMEFSNVKSQEGSALTNYYLIASYHWLF